MERRTVTVILEWFKSVNIADHGINNLSISHQRQSTEQCSVKIYNIVCINKTSEVRTKLLENHPINLTNCAEQKLKVTLKEK